MKDDVKNVVKDENLSGSPLEFPSGDEPDKAVFPENCEAAPICGFSKDADH